MILVFATNIDEIDNPSFECIRKNIKYMLPTQKYEQIVSYNDYKDTYRSILGIALVKLYLVNFEHKAGRKLKYTNGKPEICGSRVEFNISHSGDWVVCAFGKDNIGVDIERKNYNERILERCFNGEEKKYINESSNREEMINNYTKSWTIKESYIKYLGIGLRYGMKNFSINYEDEMIEDGKDSVCYFSREFESEYYLSVCSRVREKVDIVKVDVCSLLNV